MWYFYLDEDDPGDWSQPGEESHAPGEHCPGHPVSELVETAECDVRL